MAVEPEVTITLTFARQIAERLAALDDGVLKNMTLAEQVAAVLDRLADHAQQAVYRPGSWERSWAVPVFGTDWLANLEPDNGPGMLSADGRVIFERPRRRDA